MFQVHLHKARLVPCIDLDKIGGEAPLCDPAADFTAEAGVADAADEAGVHPERMEVGCDIERGTADKEASWERVPQDFADDEGPSRRWSGHGLFGGLTRRSLGRDSRWDEAVHGTDTLTRSARLAFCLDSPGCMFACAIPRGFCALWSSPPNVLL